MVNGAYEIIDDANDFPHRGGMYKVGDNIMVWHREYDYCVDRIVGELPYTGTPEHPNHPAVLFQLESGSQMHWSGESDSWQISRNDTVFSTRVRRPLADEPTFTIGEKIAESAGFRY